MTASFTVMPEFSSTAKSPSSWGSSSHRMARDTLTPVGTEVDMAAPMARPSMKL